MKILLLVLLLLFVGCHKEPDTTPRKLRPIYIGEEMWVFEDEKTEEMHIITFFDGKVRVVK